MTERPSKPPPGLAASAPDAESGGGDPFPRERFLALIGRLPRYLRLAWGLAREPRLSRTRKAAVLAAAGYLASPVDLVPGIIPVVGQLDDIAVALLALRAALRAVDPATGERRLAAAGLAAGDLDTDLGTLGATAGWLARRGLAIGRRLGILAAAASLAVGRAGVHAARRRTPIVVRSGSRLAWAAGGALARSGRGGLDAVARRTRRTRREDDPGSDPG